jgi:hypothetical protein
MQPNVENPNLEGAGGNQPPVSPEQGKSIAGQPDSSQELLLLKQNQARLEAELKGLQGRQDKATNETQRFMDEIRSNMAKGMSLDDAERAVNQSRETKAKDDLITKMAQKLGVLDESPQNNTGTVGNVADVVAVISEYGLDLSDPVVKVAFEGKQLSKQEAELLAGRLLRDKSKLPTPTDAQAPSQTGTPIAPANVEALTEQYQKEAMAARGNPKLLKSLKDEARKKGVPVDQVVFT